MAHAQQRSTLDRTTTDKKLALNRVDAADCSMRVSSPAFSDGERIPQRFAEDGGKQSPALEWTGIPPGTRELAIICEDPDAPGAHPFVHWIALHIPPTATSIHEGMGSDGRAAGQGVNSSGDQGYMGPLPPRGHGVHHYHFQVLALDEKLPVPDGASLDDVVKAARGHVLNSGALLGTYERR